MHGTGARSNLAPVFAALDASTGQCFRGAGNGRAGTRRGTPGLIRAAHYLHCGAVDLAAASVRDVHGIDLTRAVSAKVDTAQTNRESIRG
jgi:hypothetical protein